MEKQGYLPRPVFFISLVCVQSDVEEVQRGAGDHSERRLDREGVDVAECELGKLGPKATPATGYCSGARNFSRRPETGENLEEQILGEAVDPVL